MSDVNQRLAAKKFAAEWKDRGDEKSETQSFWSSLLRNVFDIAEPENFIVFEKRVQLQHTSFIDAYIPETLVLIEQKSRDVDLERPAKQSDGTMLTPFQQAKRYSDEMAFSKRPRYIVVCNFQEFHVHDMDRPHDIPQIIKLADLPREYHRLLFLANRRNIHTQQEIQLSVKAGEIVAQIYDELLKHYIDPESTETLKSLNMLCVRLVFCLYAEDAGIFGRKNQFHDYLARFEPRDLRRAIIDLFAVLNTKQEERSPYLEEDLQAFPYVNGGLFAGELEIPQFDENVKKLLLARASDNFDWSNISPTIFGAVFESTLNPETRRSGGMHFTSIENIHKVIDPLFLDDLKKELGEIKVLKMLNARSKRLRMFQDKLSSLIFLDPACGSGNFLTETYLSLRRLENEVLQLLDRDGHAWLTVDPVKVSIRQFYGIELNDFAVSVARTALWIAESQMLRETEEIVHMNLDFLPLKSYPNIVEGNALRLDWNDVVPRETLNYIMGNPPFVGARLMNKEQKDDLLSVFGEKWKNAGNLDYVSCWYKKATDLMQGTHIRAALVSTNSISQGEQVAILWKPLFEQGLHIDFAYRTFRWDSEANIKAHVHCVIIGFSVAPIGHTRWIFDENGVMHTAENISPYLIDAPVVFIESRNKPLCDIPYMCKGNQPTDDGNFLFSEDEKNEFIKQQPEAQKFIRDFVGAEEFINAKKRYCLWLKNVPSSEIIKLPAVLERIDRIRSFRLKSSKAGTRKKAEVPMLFDEIRQPEEGSYIIVPSVSSEKREYVPIGFMSAETIASNLVLIIPEATLHHFGVLTSSVHMAWMRAVCGRLEMRYRYSKDIVYNNFPWPDLTGEHRERIEQTAQAVLDARALYPDNSFADLYGARMYLFPELCRAHQENDRAVMKAYGFAPSMTEPEIVAELMKRYQKLTAGEK